jgi:hypothetical protein
VDALLDLGGHAWATETLPLSLGPSQSGVDALDDHGPLELGEDPEHLEQSLSCWSARIHTLLMQVQVHTLRAKLAKEPQQVLKGSPKLVYGPRSHHVKVLPLNAQE